MAGRASARAGLALLALLSSTGPRAEAADPPGDATVYIRLIGDVTLARGVDRGTWRETAKIENIPISTGSGFLISPSGYILTNDHVIQGGQLMLVVNGQLIEATLKVERIEVVLPAPSGTNPPTAPLRIEARVVASDPDLDLAVLHVTGGELPYVRLGDSNTLDVGEPVSVLGYPLGDDVSLDAAPAPADPPVSLSAGVLSARRAGRAFGVDWPDRYLQTTAPINPGNSGGPLVDADGYAMGIVRAKARRAEGMGFVIPMAIVRRFLEANGLDAVVPGRALSMGSFYEAPSKGLKLRVPHEFADRSRSLVQVNSGITLGAVGLRIDRLTSPWRGEEIESALLRGGTLEPLAWSPISSRGSRLRSRADSQSAPRRSGYVRSADDSGEIRMVYTVVSVGREHVVARYVGPADDVVFNLSGLLESMASVGVAPLLTAPVSRTVSAAWVADAPGLVRWKPSAWPMEEGGASACAGVPPGEVSWAASSPGDFTVALRATERGRDVDPAAAAAACAASRGKAVGASYALRVDWLGATYVINGRFIRLPTGEVVQLEGIAPADKWGFVSDLYDQWIARAAPPSQRP